MFIDAQNQYSDAQALTATAASTNLIDHGIDRNLGIGEPLAVVITVGVALAGTSPTFLAALQTDDNAAFSSATTVADMPAASTALAVGDIIVIPVPANVAIERFTRVNYTLGGTTPTVTVDAFLAPLSMVQPTIAQYSDNITIS